MQTLYEAAQRFSDGRRRVRNQPLSEKMKPGEDPCEAARRVRCPWIMRVSMATSGNLTPTTSHNAQQEVVQSWLVMFNALLSSMNMYIFTFGMHAIRYW